MPLFQSKTSPHKNFHRNLYWGELCDYSNTGFNLQFEGKFVQFREGNSPLNN